MCDTVHIRRYYKLFDEDESGSSQIEKFKVAILHLNRDWNH